MNLIFFCNNLPDPRLGGIDTVTESLATAFARDGHQCYCAYINHSTRSDIFIESLQIRANKDGEKNLRTFIVRNDITVLINQRPYEYGNIEFLHRSLSGTACDILTVFHSNPGWETRNLLQGICNDRATDIRAKLKKGSKIVLFPLYKIYKICRTNLNNRRACLYSARYILLSERFEEDFIKTYRIPRSLRQKIIAIPNPTDKNRIVPEEIKNKKKEVLIVARLTEHQKKISYALQIWRLIEQSGITDWKLTIVGTGPDEVHYKRMAADLNLKRVTFEGRQISWPYYRSAALFMMTSAYEGLPMTLLEAQRMGTVPFAFDSYASVRDLITDGDNGVLVPCFDLHGYAMRLKELMSDERKRETMALNALKTSEKFAPEAITERWYDLFSAMRQER